MADRHPLDELPPGDAYAVLMMDAKEHQAQLMRLLERPGLTLEQRAEVRVYLDSHRQVGEWIERFERFSRG